MKSFFCLLLSNRFGNLIMMVLKNPMKLYAHATKQSNEVEIHLSAACCTYKWINMQNNMDIKYTIEYKLNEIQMSWPPPGPLATSLFSSCCLPSLHLLLLQALLYLKHCQSHLFSCSSRPLTFMIIARILHLDNSPIVVGPVVEEYLGGRLARTCAHRCHRCIHLKGRSHS